MTGAITVALYSGTALPTAVETTLEVSETAGLSVNSKEGTVNEVGDNQYCEYTVSKDRSSLRYDFNQSDERSPDEPLLSIDGFGDTVHPKWAQQDTDYDEWMDIVFELVCRLATQLDANYVAWLNTARDPMSAVPEDRPIGEAIERAPVFGVYSDEVLDDLGGTDALFDREPWYVADIDGERTLIIESEQPWVEGGWRPPTDAPYLDSAEFQEDVNSDQSVGLSDPFAALETGEYGADLGVVPDDIAGEFTNDALRLRRVRVDDDRNLRRIDDNAFVRNIVDEEPADQIELIQAMLSEIPREPNTDEHASALLHDAIPPSFVRLDDPDDENVVTKVMDLETDVNKQNLLVSLGGVAQQDDFTKEDLASIESALDTLADLEGENVDAYIRQNLL
ncbi:hypothetical protein [Halosimplex amylolyticum]|uniref:hypothetical protein n=1 Tax=Halosimplex amylolyticum TaxID=3396616 RepID=UPI003F54E9BF